MTREKAIRLLTTKRAQPSTDYQMAEVYTMAIQALSQEPICDRDCEHCTWTECPIEPCDDAISREYLKKIAQSEGAYGYVSAHDIATAPSVTQKSGKWIKSLIYENTYNCSKCGSAGYDTFKYCPNCGARMESDRE